jgi:hypothetical protein
LLPNLLEPSQPIASKKKEKLWYMPAHIPQSKPGKQQKLALPKIAKHSRLVFPNITKLSN